MRTNNISLQDFAARYAAAWCSQDPASVAACYAVDGFLTVNDSAPAIGRDAIAEVARSFMTAFPDMRVLMDELRVQSGNTEFHWTLIGTNTGLGGTGHRVRISGFERWHIGPDGLIVASEGQFDSAEYQPQLEHGVKEGR
jgi:nuclear transport factor 2 (NTF2) superfamily protein